MEPWSIPLIHLECYCKLHVCQPAVDVTVYHNGYHGDLKETVFVGKVDEAGQNLVQVAYECLMKGIAIGRPCGVGLSGDDVGSVCERRYVLYVRVG